VKSSVLFAGIAAVVLHHATPVLAQTQADTIRRMAADFAQFEKYAHKLGRPPASLKPGAKSAAVILAGMQAGAYIVREEYCGGQLFPLTASAGVACIQTSELAAKFFARIQRPRTGLSPKP
jgi:hypothetical protein